jgi:hypothetical protein
MQGRLPICLLASMTVLAAFPCAAGDPVALNGSFVWERDDTKQEGSLDVTLTPKENGQWDIEFRFDWEGEPRLFVGTAWGKLDGKLTGKVDSDDPGHPLKFRFEVDSAGGVLSGTHGYYNRMGSLIPSGTLELTSADKS